MRTCTKLILAAILVLASLLPSPPRAITQARAVAAAEFVVLFVGGIDISVGAAMAVQVVLMSFFVQRNSLVAGLLISLAIALAFGVILGVANATLTGSVDLVCLIACDSMPMLLWVCAE